VFEIGSSLREARVRQGLEFTQVEHGTKIRGKYLRALEEEHFELLPGQAYVKGFLRTYADYLGLDGQLYVDEFNSRYVANEDEVPIRARRTAAPRRARHVQSRVMIAALVGIALVTALVIAAWKSGSPSHQNVVGLTTPAKVTPRIPLTKTLPTFTLRAVRGGLALTVRLGGASGRVLLANEQLHGGDARTFDARKLWVTTGTPENLRVLVDGVRVKLPVGRPQVFVISARGISAA
jgi:Helix-turn-helix domain